MNNVEDFIKKIDDMLLRYDVIGSQNKSALGPLAETLEFLNSTIGHDNSFYKTVSKIDLKVFNRVAVAHIIAVLESLKIYIQSGKLKIGSIEDKIRTEVVSEILEQANNLLNSENVHPAAPTVLIGAALEEYLRKWVEKEELSLENRKPCIDNYAKVLRENNKISAQDIKDITSWAGLRNDAAHGKWEEVNDKKRISIMLEGINLFMRQTNIGGINES